MAPGMVVSAVNWNLTENLPPLTRSPSLRREAVCGRAMLAPTKWLVVSVLVH